MDKTTNLINRLNKFSRKSVRYESSVSSDSTFLLDTDEVSCLKLTRINSNGNGKQIWKSEFVKKNNKKKLPFLPKELPSEPIPDPDLFLPCHPYLSYDISEESSHFDITSYRKQILIDDDFGSESTQLLTESDELFYNHSKNIKHDIPQSTVQPTGGLFKGKFGDFSFKQKM